MKELTFIVLPNEYALCRLAANDAVPTWALSSSFYSITKTIDELSVVCEAAMVTGAIKCSKGWRLLKIASVLDLSLTGITAKFSTALADVGVNLCVVATYDTDYIIVQQEKLNTAITALENIGFIVRQ
jgi:uncharacterized protein